MYCHLSHKPSSRFAYAVRIIIFRHLSASSVMIMTLSRFKFLKYIPEMLLCMLSLTVPHAKLWQSHFTSTDWEVQCQASLGQLKATGPGAGVLRETPGGGYKLSRGEILNLVQNWPLCGSIFKKFDYVAKATLFPFSYPRDKQWNANSEIQHRIALIYLVCLATTISTTGVCEILPPELWLSLITFFAAFRTTPSPLAFLYLGTGSFPPSPRILIFLMVGLHRGAK